MSIAYDSKIVVSHYEHLQEGWFVTVTNRLMCGSTVRKTHGVAIWKSSEVSELSGSKGVCTFRKSGDLLADT